MLPFSDFQFLYFMLGAIAFVAFSKHFLSKWLSYRLVILIISLSFLVFYPKPIQLIVFTLYSYGVLRLSVIKFKGQKKLWMTILALLPMLAMKFNLKSDWFQLAGLSYITFRTIQTIIDTNKKEQLVSIIDFTSFTLFTPTLLIGPIDNATRFITNINDQKSFNSSNFFGGVQQIIEGLVLKFVLAKLVSDYWLEPININCILDHINYAYAYTVFLYFDFAGYSALAVGFGKCLGINVPINFNKPFLAINPSDFWRRWHKSLGDWLKDYFFRPIYKELSSKKLLKSNLQRQNLALFLTFFLMGCWNGFQLHYIASGAIFGVYSMAHNTYVYKCKKNKRDVVFGNLPPWLVKLLSIIIMINLAVFAIYVFSGHIF